MHSNLRYLRVIFSQVAIITDKEIRGRISEYPDSKNSIKFTNHFTNQTSYVLLLEPRNSASRYID